MTDKYPYMTAQWHMGHRRCTHPETLWLTDRLYSMGTVFQQPEVRLDRHHDNNRPMSNYGYCDCDEPMPRTRSNSWTIEVLEPAMIMDRVVVNPCEKGYQYRGFAEAEGTQRGWAERFEDDTLDAQEDMVNAAARRREWLSAQTLFAGEYTMEGESDQDGNATYKKKRLLFNRDPHLEIKLEGDDAWDSKTLSIMGLITFIGYLQNLLSRVGCGQKGTKLVMGALAAQKLMALEDWMKYVCCTANSKIVLPLNFNPAIVGQPAPLDGVRNLGDIVSLGVEVCVYDGWYTGCKSDANGNPIKAAIPYVPPNMIALVAEGGDNGYDGYQHYGAIVDGDAAGMGATGNGDMPEFIKSEAKFVTGGRDIIYKSKPLVGAMNINASVVVEVCEMTDTAASPVMTTLLHPERLTKQQKTAYDKQAADVREALKQSQAKKVDLDAELIKERTLREKAELELAEARKQGDKK